jgi:GrpB-like predicted nucleotidyltransferase (UPF0157 family)
MNVHEHDAQLPRSAVVVDYDECWPHDFATIRAHLWPAVVGIASGIEHVGSTAVPALAAKPVIDVDVVVPNTNRIRPAIAALESLGHKHEGDLGIAGREAFTSAPGFPEHHLYVVVSGSPAHRDHVDLRDYLRAHPAQAQRYAAEKRRLAHLLQTDRRAYVTGKAWLVREILHAARSNKR